MTSAAPGFREEFGATVAALADAMAAGDETAFFAELDSLLQRRERMLFLDLRKLTGDLQSALQRFRVDSRLADLAEKDVPNARLRLDHVLRLTDAAAHRTLDLVEQSGPLAERTARNASELMEQWQRFRERKMAVEEFQRMVQGVAEFLQTTTTDMETVRVNLSEVLLAQSYQDLSGQIIRGVMKLVTELEIALADLVRLSQTGTRGARRVSDETRRGFGPPIPGINSGPSVGGQPDVDELLSGLGV
jgi:chemotaxis protein CheZ